jgi:hypothetical protein
LVLAQKGKLTLTKIIINHLTILLIGLILHQLLVCLAYKKEILQLVLFLDSLSEERVLEMIDFAQNH